MAFGIDYSKAQTVIPPGAYEVAIAAAYEDVTKSGKPYINIKLVVRDDVEQLHKKSVIWYKLWKRKEPTANDRACNDYSYSQIANLSKAVGIEDKKQYASLEEWLKDIKDRALNVTVKHKGEYNGLPNIDITNVKKSAAPPYTPPPQHNPPPQENIDFTIVEDIDDSDVPF